MGFLGIFVSRVETVPLQHECLTCCALVLRVFTKKDFAHLKKKYNNLNCLDS